jgi:Gpi18-like mannosyltransferase
MVLSIFFLTQKKYLFSAFFLAISFLIKPQTIAIFPVYALFALKNFEVKNWIKFTILFLVTIAVFAFPFFTSNPILQLAQKIITTADEYKYTALNPYNFWGIIGYWIDDTKNYFYGITYQHWGEILLAIFWIVTGSIFFTKKLPLYTIATLANLAFFFLPTRVHERYLYPALVLLIFAAIELKSELLLYLQDILSVIYFLNLYQVYVYYNETTEGGVQVLMIPSIYNFLAENAKIMSIATTCFFIGLWVFLLVRPNVQKD